MAKMSKKNVSPRYDANGIDPYDAIEADELTEFRGEPAPSVRDKFVSTQREMSAAMIERDDEIELTLVGILAGENVLFVGPPGCAKSMLLRALQDWMDGNFYEHIFSKNSLPEELFGPVSLAAFKEERYRRVTKGRLPEAHLAFLDEIWKSGPAILNTLLRILNEGLFENDGIVSKVPLLSAVAGSNEYPNAENGKELGALLDRFLIRKNVKPIGTAAGKLRLLDFDGTSKGHKVTFSTRITPAEIERARDEASAVPFSDEAKTAFLDILKALATEGIVPGDRRQYKAVNVCRAAAYLSGSDCVRPEHLEILAHVLWDDPIEQPEKAARVVARIANPAGMAVNQYLLETESIMDGTDVRNLGQATDADSKLREILAKLEVLGDHPKAVKASGYVRDRLRALRIALAETY